MDNARACSAASATSHLAHSIIPRRDPTPRGVQVETLLCGICHSDLHYSRRLKLSAPADHVRVVEGDILKQKTLEAAMTGRDVVCANLAGEVEQQARCIVAAMRESAGLIEASGLDYTIIRPAWVFTRRRRTKKRKGLIYAKTQIR
jgi:uncharacterized protein YbjT (DUF2867 family)